MSAAARRGDAAWLRAQVQDLADHLQLASRERSIHEIRRDLYAIISGESWRLACAERSRRR